MLKWTSENKFEIDETCFRIAYQIGGTSAQSGVREFIIVKPPSFIERYQSLRFGGFRKILELGVFQGGSFVFLDKLLNPSKISAIEVHTNPLPALDDYVAEHSDRARVHYGISQGDADALKRIVRDDFGGEVDLVVDDASHWYDLTKTSFLTLFPLLRPGGLYIIEDWGWSFFEEFQGPTAPWQDQKALVNLIHELLEEICLNDSIAELTITRDMVLIRKLVSGTPPLFSVHGRRGRAMSEL